MKFLKNHSLSYTVKKSCDFLQEEAHDKINVYARGKTKITGNCKINFKEKDNDQKYEFLQEVKIICAWKKSNVRELKIF